MGGSGIGGFFSGGDDEIIERFVVRLLWLNDFLEHRTYGSLCCVLIGLARAYNAYLDALDERRCLDGLATCSRSHARGDLHPNPKPQTPSSKLETPNPKLET